jgi:hypothetical protein
MPVIKKEKKPRNKRGRGRPRKEVVYISPEDLTKEVTSGTHFRDLRTIDGQPFLPYFWGLFDKFYGGALTESSNALTESSGEEITLKKN